MLDLFLKLVIRVNLIIMIITSPNKTSSRSRVRVCPQGALWDRFYNQHEAPPKVLA